MCATVANMELADRSFLVIGCGSGVVSLVAARRGAIVSAMDISPLACEATRANAAANGATVDVFESDLYANVEGQFDVVVVTPPYFRHDPQTQLERAFHAGGNFEYFHGFDLQIHRSKKAVLQWTYVFRVVRRSPRTQ
jgi:release factor glutamine methyltransferase